MVSSSGPIAASNWPDDARIVATHFVTSGVKQRPARPVRCHA